MVGGALGVVLAGLHASYQYASSVDTTTGGIIRSAGESRGLHALSGDGIANETVASAVGGVVAIGGSVLALSGCIVARADGTLGTAGAIDAGSGISHTESSTVVVDACLSGAGRISGAGDGGIVALCLVIDDGANIVGARIIIVTDSRAEGSALSCGGITSVDSAGSDGGRAGVGDGRDAHTLVSLGGGNDRTT